MLSLGISIFRFTCNRLKVCILFLFFLLIANRHVGLKRLLTGAFVKNYEDIDKEVEQAIQMTLSEAALEDPRFTEKGAPPLSEEFPTGSKIFLGGHAYGVAAQVFETTETALSVTLAVNILFRLILFGRGTEDLL